MFAGDKKQSGAANAFEQIAPIAEQSAQTNTKFLEANKAFCDYYNTACSAIDILPKEKIYNNSILNSSQKSFITEPMRIATNSLIQRVNSLPPNSIVTFNLISINRAHKIDFLSQNLDNKITCSRPLTISATREQLLKILNSDLTTGNATLYEASSLNGYFENMQNLLQEGHFNDAEKYRQNLITYLNSNDFNPTLLELNQTDKQTLLSVLSSSSNISLKNNFSAFMQSRYQKYSQNSAQLLPELEQGYSQMSQNFFKLQKFAGDINTWDQRFANGGLLSGYWALIKTTVGDQSALGEWKQNLPGDKLAQSVLNCSNAFDIYRRSYEELKKSILNHPNDSHLISQKMLEYQASFANLQLAAFDTQTKAAHFEKTGFEYIMGWAGTIMDAALPFAVVSLTVAATKGVMFAAQSGTKALWQTAKITLPQLAKTNLKIAAGFTAAEVTGRLEEISTLQQAFNSFEKDKTKTIESMDLLFQAQYQTYLNSDVRTGQMDAMFASTNSKIKELKNMKFEDVQDLSISEVALTFAQVYAISFAFTAGHRFSKTFDMQTTWAKQFSTTAPKQNVKLFESMLEQTNNVAAKSPNAQGYAELEQTLQLYLRMSQEGKTIPMENFNKVSSRTSDYLYRANIVSPKATLAKTKEVLIIAKRRLDIKISAKAAAKNRSRFDAALSQNKNAIGIYELDPQLKDFLHLVSENFTPRESKLFADYLKSTNDFTFQNLNRVVEIIAKNDKLKIKALNSEIKSNNATKSFTKEITDPQIKDAVLKVGIHDNKNLINNVFESARNLQKESNNNLSADIQILEINKIRAIELMGELDPQRMNAAVLRTQIEGYVEFANDYASLKPLRGVDLNELSVSELRVLTSEIYNSSIKLGENDIVDIFGPINAQANPSMLSTTQINSKIIELQQLSTSSVEAAKRIEQASKDSPAKSGLISQRQALENGIENMTELSGNLIFETNLSNGVANTLNFTYPNAIAMNDIGNPISIIFNPNYAASAAYNQTLLDMSLREIVKNAVKYANSEVTVRVFTRNQKTTIQISNDIRPGEFPLTQTQFQNALTGVKNDNATSASTGFGIPLSNTIISRGLNGKINNTSTQTHTIFEVELPTFKSTPKPSDYGMGNLYSGFDPFAAYKTIKSTAQIVSSFFKDIRNKNTQPRLNYSIDLLPGLKFGNFGKFNQNQNGWYFAPKPGQDYVILRNNQKTIEPASISILNPLQNGDVILLTESGQGVMFNQNKIFNMNFQNTSYKKLSSDLTLININGRWAALNHSKTNSNVLFTRNGQDLYLHPGRSDFIPAGVDFYPQGRTGPKYSIKNGELFMEGQKRTNTDYYQTDQQRTNGSSQNQQQRTNGSSQQRTNQNTGSEQPRSSQSQTRGVFTPAKGYENFYNILELPQNATQAQIKSKITQMTKDYHPDVSPLVKKGIIDEKFAHDMTTKINKAREVLLDPEKRAQYNKTGKYK